MFFSKFNIQVGGQAVLGRQNILPTPWLTVRHGYDPTSGDQVNRVVVFPRRTRGLAAAEPSPGQFHRLA